MPFTDQDILSFFRRIPKGKVTQRDIDYSEDVWTLQPLLFYMPYSIRAKTLIEIGVADGSTTMPLLKAAAENGGILHSIDPSGCEDAKRLVKSSGLEQHWRFHNMTSDEFFENYRELVGSDKLEIDFGFIDGDHTWQWVAKDVRNSCLRLAKNGILFVSDFQCSFNWVPEALNPEIYTTNKNTEQDGSNGIYKGLRLVMEDFPHLSTILLAARCNPSILISRPYNYKGKPEEYCNEE